MWEFCVMGEGGKEERDGNEEEVGKPMSRVERVWKCAL